ncbi:hypothetical protein HYH02_003541 [Chlamydomonas schloesseri]|uniref:C-type lectin domain-containing protein n=1 Tax=Chlamydomonas schloesseri TaxID=2026947 RepID=A0A836B9H0_9CHLO|nr:hypothetical protein HYH02_003541 [Chlamydomonas schloesseri]|eukprot:KAG2451762.1 hypothetical protein HYH02_003541 [Chlamydomonas schloesseri]
MRHQTSRMLVAVALCALAGRLGALAAPFATVTLADGSTYTYTRTDAPISAKDAAAACAAAGGQLASLSSAEQVKQTLWSQGVVDAATEAASESDAITTLHWTGLKITWPGGSRRMLRAAGVSDGADDSGAADMAKLVAEMDASDFPVPSMTADGRRIPTEVRAHLYQQRKRALLSTSSDSTSSSSSSSPLRRLMGTVNDGTGNEAPYLRGAELTWADGSATDFVLSNPGNLGFAACNRKKVSECCGAVFDIGPDPYPGSDFPTIFFYPCDASVTKVTGSIVPQGYTCVIEPVAALPGDSKSPAPKPAKGGKNKSPAPSGSTTTTCKPGFAPAGEGKGTKTGGPKDTKKGECRVCSAKTYSDDGTACKKCPVVKARGATSCPASGH